MQAWYCSPQWLRWHWNSSDRGGTLNQQKHCRRLRVDLSTRFVFLFFFYLARSQMDTIKVFKWAPHCYVHMVESIPPPADPLCPVESLPCMSSQTLELDGLVSPSLLSAAHLASIGSCSCFSDKAPPTFARHCCRKWLKVQWAEPGWKTVTGVRGGGATWPSKPHPLLPTVCVHTSDFKSCLCKSFQD